MSERRREEGRKLTITISATLGAGLLLSTRAYSITKEERERGRETETETEREGEKNGERNNV